MSEKKYYKDKRGNVCWIENNAAHYNGFSCSIMKNDNFTKANKDDIKRFKKEEKRRKEIIKKRREKEQQILSLIGLTPDDFCRFRNVWLTDDKKNIEVETRENGVNATSIGAIKKANQFLMGRKNDESDSTYAYYTFKNPSQQDR